jgi:hypothetical protein
MKTCRSVLAYRGRPPGLCRGVSLDRLGYETLARNARRWASHDWSCLNVDFHADLSRIFVDTRPAVSETIFVGSWLNFIQGAGLLE